MRLASLLLALALFVPLHAFGDPADAVPSLVPAELEAKLAAGDAPLVIDVRTPAEYAAGHVPGAINISFDTIAAQIRSLDAPHGLALYCMVGPRARKGEAALLASGYAGPLFHIEGGFSAWQAAGLPVAKSASGD